MQPDLLDLAMLMCKRHIRTIRVCKQRGWTKAFSSPTWRGRKWYEVSGTQPILA